MTIQHQDNNVNLFVSAMCATPHDSRARPRRALFTNHHVRRTTKLVVVMLMILCLAATTTTTTMARPFGGAAAPVGKRAAFFTQRQGTRNSAYDRNARLVSSTGAAAAEDEEEAIVADYAFIRPASPEDLAQLHEVGFSYSVKHKKQHQEQQHETVFASELEMLESDVVSVSGRSDCYQPELQCL